MLQRSHSPWDRQSVGVSAGASGHQVGCQGVLLVLVEGGEVGDQLAGAHEADAGEVYPVEVQGGLDAVGFLLEPGAHLAGHAQVVGGVAPADGLLGDVPELRVVGGGGQGVGRQDLLQDVSVVPEEQVQVLPDLVGKDLHRGFLVEEPYGLVDVVQPQDLGDGVLVVASEVVVRPGSGEAVQVGPGHHHQGHCVGELVQDGSEVLGMGWFAVVHGGAPGRGLGILGRGGWCFCRNPLPLFGGRGSLWFGARWTVWSRGCVNLSWRVAVPMGLRSVEGVHLQEVVVLGAGVGQCLGEGCAAGGQHESHPQGGGPYDSLGQGLLLLF